MKIFNRTPKEPPRWNPRYYRKALKRTAKMDTTLLMEYADMAGTGMAMAFSDYRKEGQEQSLDEIELGLVALWAVVTDLRSRRG